MVPVHMASPTRGAHRAPYAALRARIEEIVALRAGRDTGGNSRVNNFEAAPDGSIFEFTGEDGELQKFERKDGKWHATSVTGPDGQPVQGFSQKNSGRFLPSWKWLRIAYVISFLFVNYVCCC